MAQAVENLTRREALVADLARDLTDKPARREPAPSHPALAALRAAGTELWLDTGNLDEAAGLWTRDMTALTTNNTLANQVVQTGIMDGTIRNAAKRIREVEPGVSDADLVMDVAFVVNCHIALRLVSAFDALVSVELHPAIATDMEKSYRYAQRYYAINPDRFIVKIPLTPEGYCAVARARQEGIPINYTLGFSARQNYLAALVARPTYVNVFLGRLNQVISENKLGDGKYVGERTALASQAGLRELSAQNPDINTRQIAASMRSGEQLLALAGMDVYTMPPKAVKEFLDMGVDPAKIQDQTGEDYAVQLAPDADKASVELLWTLDDRFKRLAHELGSRGGASLTAKDLRDADRDHGTQLFASFTPEQQRAIQAHGKIPNAAEFKGIVALDDLMTQSALQSFAKDQEALDTRIRQTMAGG